MGSGPVWTGKRYLNVEPSKKALQRERDAINQLTDRNNWHVGYRLADHLKHHRSQRPYRLPEGMTYYAHLQRLGLEFLGRAHCDSY